MYWEFIWIPKSKLGDFILFGIKVRNRKQDLRRRSCVIFNEGFKKWFLFSMIVNCISYIHHFWWSIFSLLNYTFESFHLCKTIFRILFRTFIQKRISPSLKRIRSPKEFNFLLFSTYFDFWFAYIFQLFFHLKTRFRLTILFRFPQSFNFFQTPSV